MSQVRACIDGSDFWSPPARFFIPSECRFGQWVTAFVTLLLTSQSVAVQVPRAGRLVRITALADETYFPQLRCKREVLPMHKLRFLLLASLRCLLVAALCSAQSTH